MTTLSFPPAADLSLGHDDPIDFLEEVPDDVPFDMAADVPEYGGAESAAGIAARHPSGYSPDSALDRAATFDSWAHDFYHPIALRLYDRAVARMVRRLAPPAGGVVLDAGCGTGVHSVRVARAGYLVHGVDVSEVALESARRHAAERGQAGRITFEQADVTRLPYPDGLFDAVFSWGVVVHIPDFAAAAAELVRVLRPGGRLALQVTNCRAWEGIAEKAARAALGKPAAGRRRAEFGVGWWCRMHGGDLWNWRMDVPAVTDCLAGLGCRRTYRGAVEFTEWQRRLRGPARRGALRFNNLWLRLRLPAGPASTNLLVFEKAADAPAAVARPAARRPRRPLRLQLRAARAAAVPTAGPSFPSFAGAGA